MPCARYLQDSNETHFVSGWWDDDDDNDDDDVRAGIKSSGLIDCKSLLSTSANHDDAGAVGLLVEEEERLSSLQQEKQD